MNLTAPTSWQEIQSRDLPFVVWLRSACLSQQEKLVAAFCHFTHTKIEGIDEETLMLRTSSMPFRRRDKLRISTEQLNAMLPKFAFILEERPEGLPNPTRINAHLIDSTFLQYFTADALFLRYSLQGGRRYVRRAVSALGWHPLLLSNTRCQVILIWWNSVQRYLQQLYPYVYDDSGAGVVCSPFKTHQDIMLLLNENHPQNNAAIDAANVHAVLGALSQTITEMKKNERHQ